MPEACRGALVRRADGSVWVFTDEMPSPEERRATLLHELVHLERGSARWAQDQPAAWDAVVAREDNNRVDDIVADRMVPDAEFDAFVFAHPGPDVRR